LSLNDGHRHWYAVQTRSNFEKCVLNELLAKGVESYYPALEELHQWADRKKVVQRPLFPGYVFARFRDTAPTRLLAQQTNGAVRILGVGQNIEPIPDWEIGSIQKMLKSGGSCFPHPFLTEGVFVRVRRGAFKGVEGMLVRVKNRTRLVLSVSLIAQSLAIEVNASDVEAMSRKTSFETPGSDEANETRRYADLRGQK
jgi:transcription antitermination factor NusG